MSDTTAYASNATLAEIAQRLLAAPRVAVLTHAKPDGDALGSSLALTRALLKKGVQACPVYLGPWSPRFNPLIGATPVIHERAGCWEEEPLAHTPMAAVVDTGSWAQLGEARRWLEPRSPASVLIDHHSHGDAGVAGTRCIDPRSASACEMVAELCRLLLGLRSCAEFPTDIAQPLYLGAATDTGWFRYSNTRPATFRLAADLLDAGVDHAALYRLVEQNESPRRLMLVRRSLESLEMLEGGRVALMTLSLGDITQMGATLDELGGLYDLPQSVGSVRVVAMLTETEPGLTKVSFRSKPPAPGEPLIDVNRAAQTLGGGGHVHAAGAKMRGTLEQARQRTLEALRGVMP